MYGPRPHQRRPLMQHPPRTNRYADQRRVSRARVHFKARYSSPSLSLEGHVTDLSPDGLFFSSDFLDDQGESAQVVVDVPTRTRPLELRGEVRWVKDAPNGAGMGIRFVDVSLEDRALLRTLAGDPATFDGAERVPSGRA
jgi:uncharacterized protein (TIGR02266 family)